MKCLLKDGKINVDRAKYFLKHAIVDEFPVKAQDGAILGNGVMGALVYQEPKNLVFKLGRSDIFGNVPNSGTCGGLETLPSMGEVRIRSQARYYDGKAEFQQTLSLYDAILKMHAGLDKSYVDLESFVYSATESADILAIQYQWTNSGEKPFLEYSIWENRNPEFHIDAEENLLFITEKYKAGKSENGFTMAVFIPEKTMRGSLNTMQRKAALSLQSNGYRSIEIYILSAVGYENYRKIYDLQSIVQKHGYEGLKKKHMRWWHHYFSDSFLSLSRGGTGDAEADYAEGLWYFDLYLTASGARGAYPFKFNGGIWNVDKDYREWGSGYWNWNTRAMYWPLLSAGKFDLMEPYFRYYSGALKRTERETPAKFQAGGPYEEVPKSQGWPQFPAKEIRGVKFPETMEYDGSGAMENQYVFLILSTGTDIATLYQWYYEYTLDETFLRERAYPLMKGVIDFLYSYAGVKGADGKYHFTPSNGREQWWNVSDAADAVAGCRATLKFLLSVQDKINADAETVAMWKEFSENLTDLPSDGEKYLPAAKYDPADRKNADNPETECIFPYGLTGIAASDYAAALQTYFARQEPLRYGWSPETIVSARLGLGEETFTNLLKGIERFQVFSNGMTRFDAKESSVWDKIFYTEFNGILATTLNEMLLQSYDNVLRVFPAVPASRWDNTAFTLYAKGGFRVTSEMAGGKIKYISIVSLKGATCRVWNVFGEGKVQLEDSGQNPVFYSEEQGILTFQTVKGERYILFHEKLEQEKLTKYRCFTPKNLKTCRYGTRKLSREMPRGV